MRLLILLAALVLSGSHYPDTTGTARQVTRWHERSAYLKSPTTRWMPTTWGAANNGGGTSFVTGRLYTTLWVAPVTGNLTVIAAQNTNTTSYTCRTGVYASNDDGFPDTLISDFGEQTWAVTGVVQWTGSAPVTQGHAYWIAFWCAGSTAMMRTTNGTNALCIRTSTTPVLACGGFYVTYAWTGAALPSAWPAGTIVPSAVPLYLLRMVE